MKLPAWIKNGNLLIGASILLFVSVIALSATWITPYHPNANHLTDRLKPPVWEEGGSSKYILGTDQLGRDLLSRMIMGSRISLIVGLAAVAIQGVLGSLVGLIAGYYGGWIDTLLMRIADIQLSIPFLILAIAVSAVLGTGVLNVIIVLGLVGWAQYARIAYATTRQVRGLAFIEAAKAIGSPNRRILSRHILPNIFHALLVTATFQMARMILAEASLSFLGLGVPIDVPTWGSMIASGRGYLSTAWWISTIPGIAIMMTVLAVNLLGNALRDIRDPRYYWA